MFPLLQDGDTIEYIQLPFHKIKLNDIVLVYSKDILVTHRVIYKTKKTCITRGDNNAVADPTIQKGKVLAKMARFRRKGMWYDIQDAYLMQSSLYLNEIQRLELALQLKQIPHVFLKGVLVSLRYEHTIPKRIYADCDILIQRIHYQKMAHVMKALGYTLVEKTLLSKKKENQEKNPEVSYAKTVNGILIVFDVHFEPVFLMTQLSGMNLLYPKSKLIELGELLINRAEQKKLYGFNYSLCSISDQILYLALHIFHHNFTDSIRYQLLDAVARKNMLKETWEELEATIRNFHLEGYTYGVFLLLKKYFKTPIPPSFLQTIRPDSLKFQVTSYKINHTDIFSQDSRMKAGIERFILIFFLSPEPLWKKSFLFIHPEVLYTGFKIALDKLNTIRL